MSTAVGTGSVVVPVRKNTPYGFSMRVSLDFALRDSAA